MMSSNDKIKCLFNWCVNQTKSYKNVNITNFTSSWRNGLGFCAILHRYGPEFIDYDVLNPDDVYKNCELAFDVGENCFGINALLDANDMVEMQIPDRLSIITYLFQYYSTLSSRKPKIACNLATPLSPLENISDFTLTEDNSIKAADSDASRPARGIIICELCSQIIPFLEKLAIKDKNYHRTCYRRTQLDNLMQRNIIQTDRENTLSENSQRLSRIKTPSPRVKNQSFFENDTNIVSIERKRSLTKTNDEERKDNVRTDKKLHLDDEISETEPKNVKQNIVFENANPGKKLVKSQTFLNDEQGKEKVCTHIKSTLWKAPNKLDSPVDEKNFSVRTMIPKENAIEDENEQKPHLLSQRMSDDDAKKEKARSNLRATFSLRQFVAKDAITLDSQEKVSDPYIRTGIPEEHIENLNNENPPVISTKLLDDCARKENALTNIKSALSLRHIRHPEAKEPDKSDSQVNENNTFNKSVSAQEHSIEDARNERSHVISQILSNDDSTKGKVCTNIKSSLSLRQSVAKEAEKWDTQVKESNASIKTGISAQQNSHIENPPVISTKLLDDSAKKENALTNIKSAFSLRQSWQSEENEPNKSVSQVKENNASVKSGISEEYTIEDVNTQKPNLITQRLSDDSSKKEKARTNIKSALSLRQMRESVEKDPMKLDDELKLENVNMIDIDIGKKESDDVLAKKVVDVMTNIKVPLSSDKIDELVDKDTNISDILIVRKEENVIITVGGSLNEGNVKDENKSCFAKTDNMAENPLLICLDPKLTDHCTSTNVLATDVIAPQVRQRTRPPSKVVKQSTEAISISENVQSKNNNGILPVGDFSHSEKTVLKPQQPVLPPRPPFKKESQGTLKVDETERHAVPTSDTSSTKFNINLLYPASNKNLTDQHNKSTPPKGDFTSQYCQFSKIETTQPHPHILQSSVTSNTTRSNRNLSDETTKKNLLVPKVPVEVATSGDDLASEYCQFSQIQTVITKPVPHKRTKLPIEKAKSIDSLNVITSVANIDDKKSTPTRPPPPKLSSTRSHLSRPAPSRPLPVKREVRGDANCAFIPYDSLYTELKELDEKQSNFENNARAIQEQLKKLSEKDDAYNTLLQDWLEIVGQKNALYGREHFLHEVLKKQELEDRHSDLEYEYRVLSGKQESLKTAAERAREEELLNQIVLTVNARAQLLEDEADSSERSSVDEGRKKKKSLFEKMIKKQCRSSSLTATIMPWSKSKKPTKPQHPSIFYEK